MTVLVGAIVVAIAAALWVAHPLIFGRWSAMQDVVPSTVVDREARKRVALAALKEVEYDHAAGKLDVADYAEMRGKLELEALGALRAAEADGPRTPAAHPCGFVNPFGSRYCAGCGQPLV